MYIHFLYSDTIYNDSAFYFTEIIVLISWEGTPTQIRMCIGSITFHACGGACWVNMSSLCQNPEIFMCILYLVTICSDSASYFLEILLFPWNEYHYFGWYPCSKKNGAGLHHISWYRAKEGSICLPYVKIQMLIHFQPLIIVLGFQPLIFLKWLCLLDR